MFQLRDEFTTLKLDKQGSSDSNRTDRSDQREREIKSKKTKVNDEPKFN